MSAANLCPGTLHLALIALPEARRHFEAGLTLAKQIGSLHWTRTLTGFLASCYIQEHELDRARSLLEAALEIDLSGRTAQTMGQRSLWRAHIELALAGGEPARALEIVDMMVESAPHANEGSVIPLLWKLRGDALTLLGSEAEAESTLRASAEAAHAQGATALLWRIDASLGTLYRKQGRHKEAEVEHAAARTILAKLAATVTDERLRAGFLCRAEAIVPPARRPTPRQIAKQEFGGLTARERDVAALVAQGKSNRAIANELIISERTVESHVSCVLAKLGFTARAQIAAWAVERGLAKQAQ